MVRTSVQIDKACRSEHRVHWTRDRVTPAVPPDPQRISLVIGRNPRTGQKSLLISVEKDIAFWFFEVRISAVIPASSITLLCFRFHDDCLPVLASCYPHMLFIQTSVAMKEEA